MNASYEVHLFNVWGQRVRLIGDWLRLELARTVNEVGALTLVLPGSANLAELGVDTRLEVWRICDGRQVLVTEAVWLIRKVTKRLNGGRETVEVGAVSANEVLRRAIVAYAEGTAQTHKQAEADDVMKHIFWENLGGDAVDTARNVSQWVNMQGYLSAAPVIEKEQYAYRRLHDVFREICDQVSETTRLYFDVVYRQPGVLEFRTYTGQRGTDHSTASGLPVVFSPEMGNLVNPSVTWDYSKEVNYVYVGGKGRGPTREVVAAGDPRWIGLSPLNRREAFYNASSSTSSDALADELPGPLRAGRPRVSFAGDILDTPSAAFGRDWDWGDRVVGQYGGVQYDCELRTLRIVVEEGRETITARLESV